MAIAVWIAAGRPFNSGSWEAWKSLRSIVDGRLSRRRSWTVPLSRGTERRRTGFVPSPSAATQTRSWLAVSGAQTSAPSAAAIRALHFAAQLAVWARFSQRASPPRASASVLLAGLSDSLATAARLRRLEARDRRLHVRVVLEDGVEPRHLQELLDLRTGAEELGLAPLFLR